MAEALTVGPPILAAVVTGLINLQDPLKQTFGRWLLVGAAWLALGQLLKIAQAHHQDREQKLTDGHDGLRAGLYLLYELVCTEASQEGKLRVTVHRVVPRGKNSPPEELEQLLPYVGDQGGDAGRTFSIRSGITGRAAREQKMITASRENEDWEAFVSEIVANWGYTSAEARKRSNDRKSWCAVPILDQRGNATAVIYLDSNLPEYFTEDIQQLIATVCLGITTYIRERY